MSNWILIEYYEVCQIWKLESFNLRQRSSKDGEHINGSFVQDGKYILTYCSMVDLFVMERHIIQWYLIEYYKVYQTWKLESFRLRQNDQVKMVSIFWHIVQW